jgi:hypothetical protein
MAEKMNSGSTKSSVDKTFQVGQTLGYLNISKRRSSSVSTCSTVDLYISDNDNNNNVMDDAQRCDSLDTTIDYTGNEGGSNDPRFGSSPATFDSNNSDLAETEGADSDSESVRNQGDGGGGAAGDSDSDFYPHAGMNGQDDISTISIATQIVLICILLLLYHFLSR